MEMCRWEKPVHQKIIEVVAVLSGGSGVFEGARGVEAGLRLRRLVAPYGSGAGGGWIGGRRPVHHQHRNPGYGGFYGN